jgi:DNA-binding winged helix-turn-helix (wHTH) protein
MVYEEGGRVDLPDSAQAPSSYMFLYFTLDLNAERLVRGTAEVRLRPKSFQVLRYLVERPGHLTTREELLQAVWRDVAVTDESVTKCIADIRQALGDVSQEIIRTMSGRGYLFRAEVRVVRPPHVSAAQVPGVELPPLTTTQTPGMSPARSLPAARAMLIAGIVVLGLVALLLRWRGDLFGRRATFEAIAVLPFESLSSDSDQQYLADGLTEALITNLGQASGLRVIARTSVGQYK